MGQGVANILAGAAHSTAAKHGVLELMKTAALEQGAWDMTSGHPGGTRAGHEVAARHWHAFGGLIEPSEVRGPWCSWLPTRPPGSPGSRCPWTAGTWCCRPSTRRRPPEWSARCR
ncbi:hypothetical protein GCM10023175_65630 [Pseudonocardia xishanensis]|uniref:Uncharacterized protein n=1 Tax=Pseudonocardia xishanensis TaxID=630995 RepID=A0ABP8S3S3_9PSEU